MLWTWWDPISLETRHVSFYLRLGAPLGSEARQPRADVSDRSLVQRCHSLQPSHGFSQQSHSIHWSGEPQLQQTEEIEEDEKLVDAVLLHVFLDLKALYIESIHGAEKYAGPASMFCYAEDRFKELISFGARTSRTGGPCSSSATSS